MIVHDDELCTLYLGDCVEVMRELPAESVDAVVTDPPYGLEFMGKEWDRLDAGLPQENVWKGRHGKGGSSVGTDDSKPASRHHVSFGSSSRAQFKRCSACGKRQFSGTPCKCDAPEWVIEHAPPGPPSGQIRMQRWHEAWAREAFRVAKPGAHLLAFGGTRTVHRLAAAIEDAGWEIRDMLIWGYGSGFPKSSRVNRDPRFCQCAATERSDESIDPEPETDAHTRTVEPSGRAAGGGRSGENGTHAAPDSQERYWHDHGLDGEPPHRDVATALASAPSPADALGRSRSAAPEDDEEHGSSRTPSPVRRSARPSSQGSTLPADAPASTQSGRLGSTERGPSTGSDTAESDAGTARSSEALSAWPHCKACGKPDANGYGSALKPAFEPIVMARKPLQGTIAGNVYKHGTGALNIDATRIGTGEERTINTYPNADHLPTAATGASRAGEPYESQQTTAGRWPANLILTDPIFDGDTPGVVGGGTVITSKPATLLDAHPANDVYGAGMGHKPSGYELTGYGDSGTYSRFFMIGVGNGSPEMDVAGLGPDSAADDSSGGDRTSSGTGSFEPGDTRFFLIPKSSRSDREPVLRGQLAEVDDDPDGSFGLDGARPHTKPDYQYQRKVRANSHPTVKPLDLMRHLVRLVTPPGGTVLDCFLGSGTTAIAANAEGFRAIGIEKEREYLDIALARMAHQPLGLGLDVAAPTRKAGGRQRGNKNKDGNPTLGSRRSPSDNWTGGWAGTPDVDEQL